MTSTVVAQVKIPIHVTAYGDIAVCTISKTVDYNLKEGNFTDAWNGPIKEMRERKKSDVFTKCRTCQVKEYCMLCPAKATLESGNPEFQIDFFCSVAELRARTLGSNRKTIPLMQKPVAPVTSSLIYYLCNSSGHVIGNAVRNLLPRLGF